MATRQVSYYRTDVAETGHTTEHGTARERVLRAAIDLIGEVGAGQLTHRSVAARSEVSPGTTTYHFATLEDLLRAAFELYMQDYEQGLDEALSARPLTSLEDIAAFLSRMTAQAPNEAEMARFEFEMVMHAQKDSELRPKVVRWAGLLEGRLRIVLRRLDIDRAEALASKLINLCRGAEFDVLSRGMFISETAFEARLLAELNQAAGRV